VPLDLLPRSLVCALSAWALLYAPGLALLRRRGTTLPTAFSRVLASVIVSTLAGTGLAAAERFSLPALLACNAVACCLLLLLRFRLDEPSDRPPPAPAPVRDRVGAAIFALALAVYWPAYPAFLGASDSTAYVATGISLAHHGSLAREDELGPTVPMPLRQALFDSMSQVFGIPGPPYRRMPGAMLVESLESTRAWPCFFPVPSVWSAIFVVAGAPGGAKAEEAAPGFAPLFAALALWSFWHLVRPWLGPRWGLVAVVLLGASGPFYSAARMPLSEPIAAYFVLAGLAIVSTGAGLGRTAADAGLRRMDALLAGAALGAAVFTRVEIGLFLAMAFAMLPSLQAAPARNNLPAPRPLPLTFFASLVAVASLTVAQAALVPGSYISPLLDHVRNAWILYQIYHGYPSAGLIAGVVAIAAALVLVGSRRFGLSATLRWGFVLGVLAGHAAASSFLAQRTPMWLSFYVGWTGLALAAAGGVLAWRERAQLASGHLVLALAAATALVLFYNPHVYPALPWGARRFVPLLLPLLVLLACHAAARSASRSRLLSLACLAAFAFSIVAGGRPVWGQKLMDGAWSQLEQIAAAIPEGGTVLLDRQVSPMMVGPALWLIHDRNGLSVPPTGSSAGRDYLPTLVWHYTEKGPIYFVTRGTENQVRTPRVRMVLLARVTASLRFLEQTYDRRPQRIERYVMPITVYRLYPALDPRGILVN